MQPTWRDFPLHFRSLQGTQPVRALSVSSARVEKKGRFLLCFLSFRLKLPSPFQSNQCTLRKQFTACGLWTPGWPKTLSGGGGRSARSKLFSLLFLCVDTCPDGPEAMVNKTAGTCTRVKAAYFFAFLCSQEKKIPLSFERALDEAVKIINV